MAQRTRHHRPGQCFAVQVMLIAWLLCLPVSGRSAEYLDPAHPLHERLATGIADGRVTPDEALMLALEAVFAPDELDEEYRPLNTEPLRCATGILRAAAHPDAGLDPSQLERIAAWTGLRDANRRAAFQYLSSDGHFIVEYEVTGVDSVDVTDIDPANGVPDYVERVAESLETSWAVEVDQLGFDAPATAGQPYEVQLRSIGSFGYTESSPGSPGGTRIVLRNSYAGLPANEDPQGSEIGALRVTAAHEFRHAGQFATSAWSEAGLWIEVDAVWIEDQVFDQVNDYYRYLENNSPITAPALALDDGGSASYPQSVFEFWMEERVGIGGIRAFWERRRAFPGEEILQSYDAILGASYSALDSAYVDFALFNLQTGSLSQAGTGYSEAAGYPDAVLTETRAALPARFGSAIEHLAAKLYRVDGFSGGDESVRLRLRQPTGVTLRVAALTMRDDGVRLTQAFKTTNPDAAFVLATPARRIEQLYLVVANGSLAGDVEWFFADVEEIPPVAIPPQVKLTPTASLLTLATGQVREFHFDLVNPGPPTSNLVWSARAVEPVMPMAKRAIDGSVFVLDRTDYVPAESHAVGVAVRNGSTGLEFLVGASLELPAGVTVQSGQDIVSESGLVLTYAGFDPPTSSVQWINLGGGFGAVPPKQTGVGLVNLVFATALTGPQVFNWTLDGNGFGGAPHQVSGQIVLDGPADPRLEILAPSPMPPAFVGDGYDILWFAAAPDPVTIEASRDDGLNWETLVSGTTNDGFWRWNADAPSSGQVRLRVNSAGQESAPTPSFELLQPIAFLSMVPESGVLAGKQGLSLRLRADATGIAPGDYPVRVDVRDQVTGVAATSVVTVRVVGSAVDAPAPRRTRALGARPNPFNPTTQILFELARPGHVRVEILDLRGRRVVGLVDAGLAAGQHAAPWNGLDESGGAVASGTYFWRIRTDGQEFTGKLSLVR